jgi:cell division transport system permease protein
MVEKKEGVKVIYIEEVVNKLSIWLNGLRTTGLVLLTLLIIETVLVVWTIIGMRISQRRHEIEIMRLLGATSWYIRSPFLIEGMLYGVIGSVIGVAITMGLLQSILPSIKAFLEGIPMQELSVTAVLSVISESLTQQRVDGVPLAPISPLFVLALAAVEAVIGMLIGAIGSYFAVVRNLKK